MLPEPGEGAGRSVTCQYVSMTAINLPAAEDASSDTDCVGLEDSVLLLVLLLLFVSDEELADVLEGSSLVLLLSSSLSCAETSTSKAKRSAKSSVKRI